MSEYVIKKQEATKRKRCSAGCGMPIEKSEVYFRVLLEPSLDEKGQLARRQSGPLEMFHRGCLPKKYSDDLIDNPSCR